MKRAARSLLRFHAGLLLMALAVLLPSAEAVPPSNFAVENVLIEIEQPITLRFLPDGRMLLLQKKGIIRIVNVSTVPAQSAVYMNLADAAHAHGINYEQERGLLDIAIDPSFPSQPYIYLFYTPASGGARARIARFTHVENSGGTTSRGNPGSEVVLWQDTTGYDSCCHYGGGLDFGPDGKLWLTTGDHFQGSYATDLTKSGGGVVRINKDGTVPADNPWNDGAGPNHDALFAKGLRNPFRARWDFPTGRLMIAEVGGNEQAIAWEDLHVLRYDTMTGRFIDQDYGTANDNGKFDGLRFGWPTVEGMPPHTDFPGADIQPIAEPVFGYRHNGVTAAINGGVVYRGAQFPSHYVGAYFYADSTRDFVRYVKFNADGTLAPNPNPDPISEQNPDSLSYAFDLAPQGRITCLDVGPDGALYYVSFTDAGGAYGQPNPSVLGAVRRYVYDGGNARPDISTFTGTPATGPAPLNVQFSIRATDPEGDAMTYIVDFGDGSAPTAVQPLPGNTTVNVAHTFASDGAYVANVYVSDATHTSSEYFEIKVGTPPTITSLTVSNSRPGSTNNYFRYGDVMTFAATASDPQDGALGGANMEWSVSFVRPGNTHPSFGPQSGMTSLDFPIPAQGQGFSGPVYYRCFVTVTDSSGLSTSASIDIFPEKSNITFNTVPSGIPLQVDGNTAKLTPFVLDTLINYQHTITVPNTRCVNGTQYNFVNWSNGPTTVQQTYLVPATDSSLTANYTGAGPCAGPPTTGLVLHLDSGAGVVADGTTVAAWDDQSPQGHILLAAGAPTLLLNAVNGRDAIHLDGIDDALLSTTFSGLPTVAGARTVFMVARYNAANSTTAGWAGFGYGTAANNRAFGLALTPSGTLGVQAWGSAYDFESNPPTAGVGEWLSHSAVYTNGTITQYLNGVGIGSASRTYNTNTTGGIRIGEELNGGKNLNMDVAEILVYNRALTETERLQVNDYLDQRYALTLGGGGQAPVVTITAPADGASFSTSAMPVTLTGTASDSEDGDLSASLVWQSSIDGSLGTGASITATLSPGSHVITATATDSSTLNDSATVNVFVSEGGAGGLITSGLVLQLESDLNVSTQTGTTVAGWLDQSGLGNDLVAGGAPQLITPGTPSGLPAIRLDGVDDKLERIHATDPLGGLPAANANRTVFLVGRYTSSTAWAGVSYGTGANNQAFGVGIKHPNGELFLQGWGTGNDLVSTSIAKGAGWLVQSGLLENGVATLFKDGTQIAQFTHNYNTVLTRLVIGQEIKNLGYVGMDVAAVLVYNRALTPVERSNVVSYLREKYVLNSPPVVTITAPANNSTFESGATVNFTATATDEEQGNLSTAINWTSDRDGNLGTGGALSTSSLSPGTHLITAAVVDGSGVTGSATVTVTINGPTNVNTLPATSSIVLQLEAAQGVSTSGGNVVSWSDASPRANHLTAVGNPQLLASATPSGQPAISLDGVDDRLERIHSTNPLTGLPVANGNRTVFLVGRYKSSTAWAGVSYGTGANNQAFGLGIKHPDGELFLQGWGTGNDLVSTSIGKGAGWLIQSGLLENGVATLFKNGTQIAQFTHNYNTVLTRLVVGQEIKSLGYVGIDVAAIVIYDRALNATERSAAIAYLQQKYLTASGANTAPTVDITAPADGSSFTQGTLVTFSGTANDAQQGNLSASLAWASDRDGSLGTGASVSRSNLSGGTHIVTASVTDNGGLSGLDSVSVTIGQNASPAVSISAPAEGATFAAGAPVTFTGTALDPESGNLTASIGWSSDRDGSLGTGGSLTRSSLSTGAHVITASATDGGGLTGVDSVAISIGGTAAITPQSLIRVFDGTSLNGLYPWFNTSPFADPNNVFTVQNGMLRVSGNGWGALLTQASYRDYVMVLEFKWGPLTWAPRQYKARDAGVLIHSHGVEGGWDGKLMPNHHVQIMEGSTGDLILLKGTDAQGVPQPIGLTALVDQVSCSATNWNCRGGYRWNPSGNPRSIAANLDTIHWTNWDAAWKDKKGYRGANDVERPVGEWNQLIVVANGDSIAVRLNGVKVNEAFAVFPSAGKLQLESEFAEIYFRRWDLQPLGFVPPPMITKDALPSGKRNTAYAQTVVAVGGVPPLTWSLRSGVLPTGLILNPLNGQISGVPLIAGASTFTVQVADSTGATAAQSYTLSISS